MICEASLTPQPSRTWYRQSYSPGLRAGLHLMCLGPWKGKGDLVLQHRFQLSAFGWVVLQVLFFFKWDLSGGVTDHVTSALHVLLLKNDILDKSKTLVPDGLDCFGSTIPRGVTLAKRFGLCVTLPFQ